MILWLRRPRLWPFLVALGLLSTACRRDEAGQAPASASGGKDSPELVAARRTNSTFGLETRSLQEKLRLHLERASYSPRQADALRRYCLVSDFEPALARRLERDCGTERLAQIQAFLDSDAGRKLLQKRAELSGQGRRLVEYFLDRQVERFVEAGKSFNRLEENAATNDVERAWITQRRMRMLSLALEAYAVDYGRYPPPTSDGAALATFLSPTYVKVWSEAERDAWGTPLAIRLEETRYRIASAGADRRLEAESTSPTASLRGALSDPAGDLVLEKETFLQYLPPASGTEPAMGLPVVPLSDRHLYLLSLDRRELRTLLEELVEARRESLSSRLGADFEAVRRWLLDAEGLAAYLDTTFERSAGAEAATIRQFLDGPAGAFVADVAGMNQRLFEVLDFYVRESERRLAERGYDVDALRSRGPQTDADRAQKTVLLMDEIGRSLASYVSAKGKLPEAQTPEALLEQLGVSDPAGSAKDLWGSPFRYDVSDQSYRLVSGGSDRKIEIASTALSVPALGAQASLQADIILENGRFVQYPQAVRLPARR